MGGPEEKCVGILRRKENLEVHKEYSNGVSGLSKDIGCHEPHQLFLEPK